MRNQLKDVMAREQTFINSNTPDKTQAVTEHLRRIELSILSRTSEVLRGMFEHLTQRRARMNDQIQATHLFESGKRAVATDGWDEVRAIVAPAVGPRARRAADQEDMRLFTGAFCRVQTRTS